MVHLKDLRNLSAKLLKKFHQNKEIVGRFKKILKSL
jgi:hypothetical protein